MLSNSGAFARFDRISSHLRSRRAAHVAALAFVMAMANVGMPVRAEEAFSFGSDALRFYCEGQDRYIAIIRDADDKFGISGTDEKNDWMRERQAENYAQIEKDLGAPYEEWGHIAMAEEWDENCKALARGWLAIDESDALASTGDDARKVEEALTLLYIERLDQGHFSVARDRRYTSVNCRSVVLDDFRLTGCTLVGGGFFNAFYSDPMIFMIANKNGQTAFAPLESNSQEHIQRSSYTDADGDLVMTGWYVGARPLPFDWAKAVALLGK